MFGSVAGVEDAKMYGEKGIVELGLEGAASVAVDDVEVGDGYVILRAWRGPVNWVKLGFMGLWNVPYSRWSWWTVAVLGDDAQPNVGEFGYRGQECCEFHRCHRAMG